jgi:hypothetical protein
MLYQADPELARSFQVGHLEGASTRSCRFRGVGRSIDFSVCALFDNGDPKEENPMREIHELGVRWQSDHNVVLVLLTDAFLKKHVDYQRMFAKLSAAAVASADEVLDKRGAVPYDAGTKREVWTMRWMALVGYCRAWALEARRKIEMSRLL